MAAVDDSRIPEEPLSFGDLFRHLFPIFRHHYLEILLPMLPFVLLIALGRAGSALLMLEPASNLQAAAFQGSIPEGGSEFAAIGVVMLGFAAYYLLVFPMTQIAGISAVHRVLSGESLDLAGAWQRVKRLYWRWHISYLIVFMITLGPLLLFLVPALLLMNTNTTASLTLAVLGVTVWTIAFYFLYFRVILLSPVACLGDFEPTGEFMRDCIQIFKRAWYLSWGRCWKSLFAILVLSILISFVSALMVMPVELVGIVVTGLQSADGSVWGGLGAQPPPFYLGIQQAATMVVEVLVFPLTVILYYLLWFDGRADWEAYDIQLHMNRVENLSEQSQETPGDERRSGPSFQPDAL